MITSFLYRKGKPFEVNISRSEMLQALRDKDALLWVDLEEPSEFESETLIEIFNFHPLAIEDCLSDHSQPKVDDYDDYLFLETHAVRFERDKEKEMDVLGTVELNTFLGMNYVVTFHKYPMRNISQVREMVRRKPDNLMGRGSDYLYHSILDHLVDDYKPVLERYDDKIDKLEEELFKNPPADYLATLMQVKSDIFDLRRMVTPQRDFLSFLTRNPEPFIREQNLMYFRDVYDHLYQVFSTAESFHENLSSMLQAYYSYSSHKLNEVVKHMTVMATLTMPAVIVASIYGMNFKHMPELDWQFGYLFSFGLMALISVLMLMWMKWKKWI